MTAVTFDHRSRHVTIDYGDNGRVVAADRLDPTIKYIDWDGAAGVVVYASAERDRRRRIVDKTDEDREIAETGERKIADFTPFQFLVDEWTAAEPPPTPPPDPKTLPLTGEEIAEILRDKLLVTQAEIDAKKNAR